MRNYVKTNAEENNHIKVYIVTGNVPDRNLSRHIYIIVKLNVKNSRYFPSDEEQSSRFDIYSFGVIALEMLIPMLIADAEKTKLSPTGILFDTYLIA